MTDSQSPFADIIQRQKDLLAELCECKRTAEVAIVKDCKEALVPLRSYYRGLLQQIEYHTEIYECVRSLACWMLSCRGYDKRPSFKEIKARVAKTTWFFAPGIDADGADLLLESVVEHFEEETTSKEVSDD